MMTSACRIVADVETRTDHQITQQQGTQDATWSDHAVRKATPGDNKDMEVESNMDRRSEWRIKRQQGVWNGWTRGRCGPAECQF